MTQALPDDPLRAHFSGKRAWPRVALDRPAVAVGPSGSHDGVLVDASRSGAMFLVEAPDFYEADGDGVALVERAFPDGIEIRLPPLERTFRAQVVRILPVDDGRLALGCAFPAPTDDAGAVLLGIRGVEFPVEEAAAPTLPHRAASGRPLALLLFAPTRPREGGPPFLGTLDAAGTQVVEATGTIPARLEDLAERLAEPVLHASIRVGTRPLLDCGARLLACEPDAAARPRVRVLLDSPLPRAVRRRLRQG